MSSKVANLIALELGVLIAIMAWLAFSNLRRVQSPPLAQPPTRLVDSFATVAPARQPRLPAPVDYHADLTPEPQPEEAPPQVLQEDEQEVATEPYIDTSLDAGYINQTAPYYAVAEPEPLLTTSDCLFSPVDRFVVYPQATTIVVVSDSRNFAPHPRSPDCPTPPGPAVSHRRPPVSPRSHLDGGAVAPRPKPRQQPRPQSPRLSSKPRPRQNP